MGLSRSNPNTRLSLIALLCSPTRDCGIPHEKLLHFHEGKREILVSVLLILREIERDRVLWHTIYAIAKANEKFLFNLAKAVKK